MIKEAKKHMGNPIFMVKCSEHYHEVRVLIPKGLYKKYKIICTHMDISMTKQVAQMLRDFVSVQEINVEIKTKLERKD